MTTLTRNLLVDNYRRSRMDRASESLDETYEGEENGPTKAERLADGGKSQEQHVSGLELKAQIQEALKQVSPELREAVILRDLEDMDYKDIAESSGRSTGHREEPDQPRTSRTSQTFETYRRAGDVA